jgi:hypothetical protein
MWKDPIVEEVRAIRKQIAAECDYDWRKILQRERETLKRWKGKVVTKQELMRERHKDRKRAV